MPRLSGLEVLSAIKGDPELSVIPVIMLSTTGAPEEVRRCYQLHANVYVQKPTDLEQSDRLIRAIEAFWMDFAVLPSWDDSPTFLNSSEYLVYASRGKAGVSNGGVRLRSSRAAVTH